MVVSARSRYLHGMSCRDVGWHVSIHGSGFLLGLNLIERV